MRSIPLTNKAMQVLKPALFGLGAKSIIRREIVNGISELYQSDNGRLLIVIRREKAELVVVAVAGSGLKLAVPEIINFAQTNDFNSIRIHTKHPEYLTHALTDLPVYLSEVRRNFLGKDEMIFKMRLF